MDLIEYIESLPEKQIGQLYGSASICRVVLQQLPALASQYIKRLLLIHGGVPEALLAAWPLSSAASSHDAALRKLTRLGILQRAMDKLGNGLYTIDETFRQHILGSALARESLEAHKSLRGAPAHVDPGTIQEYAQTRWEEVLLLLVNGDQGRQVSRRKADRLDVMALLSSLDLVSSVSGHQLAHITEKGFNFLLMETHQQLWILVRQYISDTASTHGLEVKDVLELLLQWGTAVNRQVDTATLSQTERMVALDLAQLGLFQSFQTGGSSFIVATPLAGLVLQGGEEVAARQGFIIVETNFRVYAYTSSAVQKAILRLFIKGEVLLPNIFIGSITRQSVMDALDCGTTGEQIISYLRQHAHPRVASRVPVVPGVVTDQIRLWDKELKRLRSTRAVLYSNFESGELFARFAEFAQSAATYVSAERRQVVVPADFHEDCKAEIKRLKQALGI